MRLADAALGLSALALIDWFLLTCSLIGAFGNRLEGGLRSALLAMGVSLAAYLTHTLIVDAVADQLGIGRLDQPTLNWFTAGRTTPLTDAMRLVSACGGTAGMTVLALVAAVLLARVGRRVEATLVAGAGLGAAALSSSFKLLYGRARPPMSFQLTPQTSFALPSGHALGSMVVIGIVVAVGTTLTGSRRVRLGLLGAGALAVLTIGLSRLYLGVHWLTDVLAGWSLGAAWLALCVGVLHCPFLVQSSGAVTRVCRPLTPGQQPVHSLPLSV